MSCWYFGSIGEVFRGYFLSTNEPSINGRIDDPLNEVVVEQPRQRSFKGVPQQGHRLRPQQPGQANQVPEGQGTGMGPQQNARAVVSQQSAMGFGDHRNAGAQNQLFMPIWPQQFYFQPQFPDPVNNAIQQGSFGSMSLGPDPSADYQPANYGRPFGYPGQGGYGPRPRIVNPGAAAYQSSAQTNIRHFAGPAAEGGLPSFESNRGTPGEPNHFYSKCYPVLEFSIDSMFHKEGFGHLGSIRRDEWDRRRAEFLTAARRITPEPNHSPFDSASSKWNALLMPDRLKDAIEGLLRFHVEREHARVSGS